MRALVLVDIQNDFLPGGALAVPDGDAVVAVANRLVPRFELVVATQDWHPPGHGSFASCHPGCQVGETIELEGRDQVLWPDHCIEDTPGADFAPGLDTSRLDRVFRKGTDPGLDSYSGFFDNGHLHASGLEDFLVERQVTQLALLGLATDYCVQFTALDAIGLGFEVLLVEDGCRGVDLEPGDVERAIARMKAAGVEVLGGDEVPG